MKFYRLGCGCVVLLSEDGTTARDIERCDADWHDDALGISDWRPVEQRHVSEGTPLTAEQEDLLVGRLRNLIADGYRHRQIARALGIMKENK